MGRDLLGPAAGLAVVAEILSTYIGEGFQALGVRRWGSALAAGCERVGILLRSSSDTTYPRARG
jgi:hypothetical protein